MQNLRPLTALRFFAALMIVLLHAKMYFPWSFLGPLPDTLRHGVSFFFVLSGFILTHIYCNKPWPGYWRFMARRAGRLWPIHAAVLAVLLLSWFVPGAIVAHDSVTWSGDGLFNPWVALALNASLLQSYSPYAAHTFAWNAPAWSISTTFAFYAAFPFLLVEIRRTWACKLAGAAMLAIVMVLLTHALHLPANGGITELTELSFLHGNPCARALEFCLGMAAWVLWDKHLRHNWQLRITPTQLEVVAVILTLFWMFGPCFVLLRKYVPIADVWFYASGSCWVFALLIIAVAGGRGAIGRALCWKPLVYLGEISVAVFMLHWILMKVFANYGLLDSGPIVYWAALLSLAALAHAWIERPARAFIDAKLASHTVMADTRTYLKPSRASTS